MFSKLWPRSRPSTEVLAKALLEAHGGEELEAFAVNVNPCDSDGYLSETITFRSARGFCSVTVTRPSDKRGWK